MNSRKPINLHKLKEMHAAGEKITMLTCYDATFAQLLDAAGVDALLVGDSLGMVLQGHATTLPAALEDMLYHTARGNCSAWLIADMPFGSYHTPEAALSYAVRLMQAGAHMVKLEGGGWTKPIVLALTERGIPVCAHLGFTPQSVHALGGFRVQARAEATADPLRRHALIAAGATLVPATLAHALTKELSVPIIGAGAGCSGQVLVLHDLLGLSLKSPRFVRNFLEGQESIASAVRNYVEQVKAGKFPDDAQHAF